VVDGVQVTDAVRGPAAVVSTKSLVEELDPAVPVKFWVVCDGQADVEDVVVLVLVVLVLLLVVVLVLVVVEVVVDVDVVVLEPVDVVLVVDVEVQLQGYVWSVPPGQADASPLSG
jgi:hypothetical protein